MIDNPIPILEDEYYNVKYEEPKVKEKIVLFTE